MRGLERAIEQGHPIDEQVSSGLAVSQAAMLKSNAAPPRADLLPSQDVEVRRDKAP